MKQARLFRLTQAIQLVALECEQQIQALPKFVAVPDEVAIILHEALLTFEHSEEQALVDAGVFDKIKRLDEYFGTLDKVEYSLEAMCDSPRWAASRETAREILMMLGLHANKPDLGWMRFVEGES